MKSNTFMVRVVLKNSDMSGYIGDRVDSWVEFEAKTLREAVQLVREKYKNDNNYIVKDDGYLMLKFIKSKVLNLVK